MTQVKSGLNYCHGNEVGWKDTLWNPTMDSTTILGTQCWRGQLRGNRRDRGCERKEEEQIRREQLEENKRDRRWERKQIKERQRSSSSTGRVKQNEPSTVVLTSTPGAIKKEMKVGKAKRVEEKRKEEESRRVKEEGKQKVRIIGGVKQIESRE
jgi:hypothetical protein